jgi:tetratricopeptide (TPR) repeat protein
MKAAKPLFVIVACTTLLLDAHGTAAQDPISAAKELYAGAAYAEALAALNTVKARSEPEVARQADEYMAFCLLALGRTSEAESAAEAAIRRDPLADIDARDASPRIEAMFAQVRKRLLPSLIRDSFRGAREAMTRGDMVEGLGQLRSVREMLDAAKRVNAWDDVLDDVGVLVDGFLELDRKAAIEPAQKVLAAAPSSASFASPEGNAANVAPGSVAVDRPARIAGPMIYSSVDPGVSPPIAVRQDIPTVTLSGTVRGVKRTAVMVVTIDEHGLVEHATIRESVGAAIDAQLLEAASSWRYQPAKKGNSPVRYVKVIGVAISN